jgi:ComF family protein
MNIFADLLIPKEKRVKLLEALGPHGLFENIPRAENFNFPAQAGFDTSKMKAIFNYKTVLCRQAIWEIKYRANKKLIRDFSLLLYEYILEELADLETFNNFKNIILLPIPASSGRKREKGFNQCILICEELIRIDRERNSQTFTMVKDFLIKKKDTLHQARVSNRKMRLKNLIGVFGIDEKQNINKKESSYLIIDDVITTGATMAEAFRALKNAGIPAHKIRGFALAH